MFYVQIINIVFGSSNSKHRHVVDVVLRTIHALQHLHLILLDTKV